MGFVKNGNTTGKVIPNHVVLSLFSDNPNRSGTPRQMGLLNWLRVLSYYTHSHIIYLYNAYVPWSKVGFFISHFPLG